MNFMRYIVPSCQINQKYERIILTVMIGQSKINAFFMRQSGSGEDRMKAAGRVRDAASECTLPTKRKRDETKSEVKLLY